MNTHPLHIYTKHANTWQKRMLYGILHLYIFFIKHIKYMEIKIEKNMDLNKQAIKAHFCS